MGHRIGVIDYGLGNIKSVVNMFRKIGTEVEVVSDPAGIMRSEKLILPGVGAFDLGISNIVERKMLPSLKEKALVEKIPVLGICLGMQLFANKSEEGEGPGLNWIDDSVRRFSLPPDDISLRVPHIGWNEVRPVKEHFLFDNIQSPMRFYFVHSYHYSGENKDIILGTAGYGYEFPAVIARENIMGVQFHPEKSHVFGMTLLKNFAEGC